MVAILQKSGAVADAPQHTAITPANVICLDIETGDAPEPIIKRALAAWEPPSNYKDPEKIEEKRKEAEEKIREKAALLDGAPIACVAARTEKVGRIFNGLTKKEYKVNHSTVVSCGTEAAMLEEFRSWLDEITTEQTTLIGFNIKGFDLRRLRSAYVRHRMKLPKVFTPRILDDERQPLVDVMLMYLRWYGPDYQRQFISLEEVCVALDLPHGKDLVAGSEIPGLIRQGKVKEVLMHAAVDTLATLTAYLLMSSSAPELR
jgi:predicted 3'-5' exonuclease similar to PolB exonuclease domain